ncbi:hypothetical protein AWZ03_014457 [Drosophila navojoa]|uniref:Chromo shadow domain-containing protein n=1 Tax=Drosophila navojoa TaxID=7232 RepID=A0A484ASR7_DRONA|nr:hypothetical protein AWZ03_014457 [Drosophila navojoa]
MASPSMNLQPGTAAPAPSPTVQSVAETPKRPRGRPRKTQLEPVDRAEENATNNKLVAKVLRRCLKKYKKLVPTVNNGFERGLKPDCIMKLFMQENQRLFLVRFKNRKLPEIISGEDLKKYAPIMLIYFYADNLHKPHPRTQ